MCCFAAGITVPFAIKAVIEANSPPAVQQPPTVKEVRATASAVGRLTEGWWGVKEICMARGAGKQDIHMLNIPAVLLCLAAHVIASKEAVVCLTAQITLASP